MFLYSSKLKDETSKSTLINSNKVNKSSKMMKDSILSLPDSKNVLVIRTDFSSDYKWKSICEMISESGNEFGFKPYVEYVNNSKFEELKTEKFFKNIKYYKHLFIFIVDRLTLSHAEHPIICIDLFDNPGDSFRVIPSEMWSVDNNLSISNIDFNEFMNSTDIDGIHRGFN